MKHIPYLLIIFISLATLAFDLIRIFSIENYMAGPRETDQYEVYEKVLKSGGSVRLSEDESKLLAEFIFNKEKTKISSHYIQFLVSIIIICFYGIHREKKFSASVRTKHSPDPN